MGWNYGATTDGDATQAKTTRKVANLMSVTFGLIILGVVIGAITIGAPLFLGGILVGWIKWGRG
jgi:hypothetical protein